MILLELLVNLHMDPCIFRLNNSVLEIVSSAAVV